MKNKIGDYMKTTFRTDLAMELQQTLTDNTGVEAFSEEEGGITTTWVKVTNQAGAEKIGKPEGNYITLESAQMKENNLEAHELLAATLADTLRQLSDMPEEAAVLVIGLGNRHVTPDALGPLVCEKLLVTRHLQDDVPVDYMGKLRSVCALAPGVMGITGIETAEIVRGVAEKVSPDLIIAIDALAARSTSRINATIQISDTGINPGAGLGNKRTPINKESTGVPVIAIGVPTVVDAATLVNDAMEKILECVKEHATEEDSIFSMLKNIGGQNRYELITEMLDPYAENMFVTPKEVDAVIERLATIIAEGLNIALHPGLEGAVYS